MTTQRRDFRDVGVDLDLSVEHYGSTRSTPARVWDGVHLWLRYQSEAHNYYASIARRDGRLVIKKKCPGGWINGGRYYELTDEVDGYAMLRDMWSRFRIVTRNHSDGSVGISLTRDGETVFRAVDRGVGCAPIRAAGAIGIRGDNARFYFRDFTVRAL